MKNNELVTIPGVQQPQAQMNSNTGSSNSSPPTRKKLKLDLEAAKQSSRRETNRERRRRLLEHRQVRLKRLCTGYRDASAELLFLKDGHPVIAAEVAAFKRKLPNAQYLEFIKEFDRCGQK